jgi:hypothetical protein
MEMHQEFGEYTESNAADFAHHLQVLLPIT